MILKIILEEPKTNFKRIFKPYTEINCCKEKQGKSRKLNRRETVNIKELWYKYTKRKHQSKQEGEKRKRKNKLKNKNYGSRIGKTFKRSKMRKRKNPKVKENRKKY